MVKKEDIFVLHKKIFAFRSFKEIFEVNRFKVEKILGAGYYPFPQKLATFFSSLDPRHGAFIIIKARKP